MKLIKNHSGSLLKGDIFNFPMHISFNGPPVTSEDGQQVIKDSVVSWLAGKNRKKLSSVPTAAGPFTQLNLAEHRSHSTHTQSQATPQTVTEESMEELQVKDEVEKSLCFLSMIKWRSGVE